MPAAPQKRTLCASRQQWMPRPLRIAVALLSGLCLMPSASALDAKAEDSCALPAAGELSLMHALRLADCLQPELSAAAARVAWRAAELAQADAAWWPELSSPVVVEHMRTDAAQIDTARAGIELRWTLADGGARAARRRAAAAEWRSARDAHAALQQQIYARISSRYTAAVEAHAEVDERARSVRRHRRSLDTAERRAQAGFAAHSDSLQARAALARAQLQLARAEGASHVAEVELGQAVGMPAQQPPRLAPGMAQADTGALAPLAEWLALAQEREPTIAAARERRRALKADVDVARACGAPSVDLALSHQHDTTRGINSASLQLRVPLHDGGRCAHQLAAARARHDEARAELRLASHGVLGMVAAAHARAHEAAAQCGAAQDWRAAARAALRSARRRYTAGLADIAELLTAQAEVDEAAQAGLRARTQWRSAELALLAAAGVLKPV
jgi:outer membrane protein